MATNKKPVATGEKIAQDLVEKIANLYAVLDEMADNSNYLPDIAKSLDRIAQALEKRND